MSNILVCGRMKEGKTTFALWLARNWRPGAGVVVWDPRHMIDIEMAAPVGYVAVIYAYDPESLQERVDNYCEGSLIVYRPSSMDMESDFNALCSVLLEPPERYHNWSLVVDEAAQLQSSYKIVPQLSRAVRQHPRSVLIIQTTHSLQDWHRASKDLTNHLFCFRLVGRSLRAVVEFCDGSEHMEETIKNLPPHHTVHISFESVANSEEFVLIEPDSWYESYSSDSESEAESQEESDENEKSITAPKDDERGEE